MWSLNARRKYLLEIFLKSGRVVKVECIDYKIATTASGKVRSYTITGMNCGLAVSVEDIEAIRSTQRPLIRRLL